jgi:hypothetical protein
MIPRRIYRRKLLYMMVIRYHIVYSIKFHCLLVDCCILCVFLCVHLVLLVFWEHAGALLFHPTHRINNLYHDWLRRAAGGLPLLFVSPYEHH